ncbi:MAG TPA: FkbM family methyltransferase [Allosphingosinicella sp.]|nr:FkbM family methyltransferase [Allosphingosinicella sp.]
MSSVWNLARRVTLLLDRRGTRWLVSGLLPLAARALPDGVRSIRYDNGWIHRFDEGVVVEPQPRMRSYDIGEARNRFLWGFLYEPKPGHTIVDVGAGLGAESLYYSKRVEPNGRVIAIEAHPGICRYLERSVALGGRRSTKVLNLALSDKKETVYIEDNMDELLGNALVEQGKGVSVEATTLEALCESEGIERIDFLKMNIEGAERLAIQGFGKALGKIAVMCISCHDFKFARTGNDFFKTKEIVRQFVEENGFVIVPRESQLAEVTDQINAYNPALIDPSELATAKTA